MLAVNLTYSSLESTQWTLLFFKKEEREGMGKKNGRRKSCGCGSVGECFCATMRTCFQTPTPTPKGEHVCALPSQHLGAGESGVRGGVQGRAEWIPEAS